METKLKSETVSAIFKDCLFAEQPVRRSYLPAEGVTMKVGFDPDKVSAHDGEIAALLAELPDQFDEVKGGGWSFLNACYDKHGAQWTGMHSVMEELFLLGIAAGRVKCLLPREMWSALPGGVPYYVVLAMPAPVEPKIAA